ncbi:hypothetical protein GCM10023212_15860 [Luteolibacter yonseiensis]
MNPVVRTNEEGVAAITYKSVHHESGGPAPAAAVEKDGWYPTSMVEDNWIPAAAGGRSSYHADIKPVMRPVKNPVPMYAKGNIGELSGYTRVPELNKDYGYDLMLGQALPPLGKGETADFHFRVEGDYTDRKSNALKLIVRFQNPNDGVVEFLTPQRKDIRDLRIQGSRYISDYVAPDSGYVNQITRFHTTSDQGSIRKTDVDHQRNFYFRTRTKTLPDGRIISANYGKIYGDFDFSSGNIEKGFYANFGLVVSYFNPNVNDRYIEFDVKKNLLTDGNVFQP